MADRILHDLYVPLTWVVPQALHAVLKAALGERIGGISTGSYRIDGVKTRAVRVHFFDSAPTAGEQALTVALVAAHGSLSVTTDKAQIAADGVDVATITCAAAAIAGDANVTYTVWRNGGEYTEPTAGAVAGGQIQLALTTNTPGTYLLEIKRTGGNAHITGYVEVRAV